MVCRSLSPHTKTGGGAIQSTWGPREPPDQVAQLLGVPAPKGEDPHQVLATISKGITVPGGTQQVPGKPPAATATTTSPTSTGRGGSQRGLEASRAGAQARKTTLGQAASMTSSQSGLEGDAISPAHSHSPGVAPATTRHRTLAASIGKALPLHLCQATPG